MKALKSQWATLDPGFLDNAEFRPFFKFCFEFNREGTKKFLEKDTAVALLPLCIENRSPHTESFVSFLDAKPNDFKLNKDQWCSFLDFSLSVGPTFTNWDADESSWPILLDEFVEFVKEKNKNNQDNDNGEQKEEKQGGDNNNNNTNTGEEEKEAKPDSATSKKDTKKKRKK